jgi:predicted nucleic acid-binding protein
VHVAVMQQHDVAEILSFDRGFDAVAGINRVSA